VVELLFQIANDWVKKIGIYIKFYLQLGLTPLGTFLSGTMENLNPKAPSAIVFVSICGFPFFDNER
jgi:hypothetical protein